MEQIELTKEQIDSNAKEIISLLYSTKREGIKEIVGFMYKRGFFYFSASSNHHHYKGGLAEHSLGVCRKALERCENMDRNSVIIASLLHDLGKSKCEDIANSKEHGIRSVIVLEELGFNLTDEEKRAIAYHTKRKSKDFYSDEQNNEYDIAVNEELRNLVNRCDILDASKDDDESVKKIIESIYS